MRLARVLPPMKKLLLRRARGSSSAHRLQRQHGGKYGGAFVGTVACGRGSHQLCARGRVVQRREQPGLLSLPGMSFSSPPVPEGTYFVRVRAVNACDTSPASLERTFTIGCPVPGSPSSPSADVSGATAMISWTAVSNAMSYRLDVGTASGTSNILSETITGTSKQLSGLSAATYFMRVTAQNACGSGPASEEATFTIGGPRLRPSRRLPSREPRQSHPANRRNTQRRRRFRTGPPRTSLPRARGAHQTPRWSR